MIPYPAPHRLTLEDLDPESATTDTLIARVRQHRQGEEYPTPETLLGNLPVVLRALCDHLLSGEATALESLTGSHPSSTPLKAARPRPHSASTSTESPLPIPA
jgi:hypothetical protein